jgi:acyl homoserine lactone synthase
MNQTITVGFSKDFPAGIESTLAQFRYQVFVQKLQWQLPLLSPDVGQERDQFDRDDTIYVVGHDSQNGRVYGCARLLSTTSPYLLGEVFPEMAKRRPDLSGPDIWEMSRFAAVSDGPRARAAAHSNARRILAGAVEYAARNNIARFVGITYLSMERLLRSMGLHVHRAGPTEIVDGEPVAICCLEVDAQTLDALGIDNVHLSTAVNVQRTQ